MDNAVALVQAYLQVNGYFTVTGYPVLEAARHGIEVATDLDVLALRFPGRGSSCRRSRARASAGSRRPTRRWPVLRTAWTC